MKDGADSMWVKICGTTNLPDALLAVEHGADALGFIFAPSKRRITADQAAWIAARLPAHVERVGVFTSAAIPEILEIVKVAGLTAVQLHLPHDPAFTAELTQNLGPEIHLIQVVGVSTESRPNLDSPEQATSAEYISHALAAKLRRAFSDPCLWAVLLDAEKGGESGGLGLTFSWKAIQPVLGDLLTDSKGSAPFTTSPKLLLAGGLSAKNVREAISILKPWGVDCVSGVEKKSGQKDPIRLADFFRVLGKKDSPPCPTW